VASVVTESTCDAATASPASGVASVAVFSLMPSLRFAP
jgi:hypothetical protein